LKGTIGDISFYKTSDGHLAREKGGMTSPELQMILRFKERVKTGPNSAGSEMAENWCEVPSGFFC